MQLSSPHAARTGVAGAMFNVLEPVGAPATARLAICTVVSAMPGTLKDVEILASKLGDAAGITGAAVLVRQRLKLTD